MNTIYELDSHGEALHAHHYCSVACRDAATVPEPCVKVDEPMADIADGEVCDSCGAELKR